MNLKEKIRKLGSTRRLRYYLWWRIRCRFGKTVGSGKKKNVTAILLSYNRPQNIQKVVDSLLKCEFIKKIIVSHNNPDYSISLPACSDNRVSIINQTRRMYPRVRWDIAIDEEDEYFVTLDDDIFLFPEQIEQLVDSLKEEPSSPRGIAGGQYTYISMDKKQPVARKYCRNISLEVDCLHHAYVVTKDQAMKYHLLKENLKKSDSSLKFHRGDDILISSTGTKKPIILDVGYLLFCKSAEEENIAMHQQKDFSEVRERLIKALHRPSEIKKRPCNVVHYTKSKKIVAN